MPEFAGSRVYLDANVLFSAAYDIDSHFLEFWKLHAITPATSLFAIGEVWRHITKESHAKRFDVLLKQTELVSDEDVRFIPEGIQLAEKDRPILAAAIGASLECLVTGDRKHFGHLYGMRISGVLIMAPADFLVQHQHLLKE